MTIFRDFESVGVFTVGAVGQPGARTFFLQMGDTDVLSVKCEKEQVAALAAFLRKTLADAPAVSREHGTPTPFNEPFEAAFDLGSVGLAYDRRDDHIVLQFDELTTDDDEDAPTSRVRVRISCAQAVTFCETAESLVRAGRPPCHFCGLPVNRDGHACPKMN